MKQLNDYPSYITVLVERADIVLVDMSQRWKDDSRSVVEIANNRDSDRAVLLHTYTTTRELSVQRERDFITLGYDDIREYVEKSHEEIVRLERELSRVQEDDES